MIVIFKLNSNSDIVNRLQESVEDLRTDASRRIRLKAILSRFHKQYYQIKKRYFKMIENWNNQDFAVSILVHFIKHDDVIKLKAEDARQSRLDTTWRFLDYLTQYFDVTKFNGEDFVRRYMPDTQNTYHLYEDGGEYMNQQKASIFASRIVQRVCKRFKQSAGKALDVYVFFP